MASGKRGPPEAPVEGEPALSRRKEASTPARAQDTLERWLAPLPVAVPPPQRSVAVGKPVAESPAPIARTPVELGIDALAAAVERHPTVQLIHEVAPDGHTKTTARAVPAAITFGALHVHAPGGGCCDAPDAPMAAECEEGEERGEAPSTSSAMPAPLALPFPTNLSELPKSTKGRAVGKYVSKGASANGYQPSVVYWNGKRAERACWKDGCVTNPAFGEPGDARPSACKACKTPTMVDVRSSVCPCGTNPSFGEPGDARPSACKKCKTPTMVRLREGALCPCGTHPSFGEPGDARPSACNACKTPTMVDLKNKNRICPCGTSMSFGEPGDERPSACKKCKTPTMVNFVNPVCPCGTSMSFGEPGDARPSACKKCKTPTMVYMIYQLCPCGTHPVFGEPGDARPSACKACKTPTMVDVVNPVCPCGSGTRPGFGEPGDAQPSACKACNTPTMVDMVHKLCLCGEGRATYEDADGNSGSLCLSCAIAEGSHPERITGASYEACRWFCLLSRMTHKREDVPHVHWDRVSGEWNDYDEVGGLVPGRKLRPDGYVTDSTGATAGTVYLFHGNRWHGYPPGHPEHDGEQVFRSARTGAERRVKNADLYAKTEADTQAYLSAGYGVVEMWAHDFKEAEKHNGLLSSLLTRRAP